MTKPLVCLFALACTTPAAIHLEKCRLPNWNDDVRCATYAVWENRAAHSGRKIAMRIVVLPALAEKPEPDPVFYFAGGPGGSAVETIQLAGKSYLENLRRKRDLVFVDQRGTGASNPLRCTMFTGMASYFNRVLDLDRLGACRAELEKTADLRQYSTVTAMEDIDEIRTALGYGKINLYGGSYGSTAAMAFLRQFPDSVRSAVLLGVAPPDAKIPLPVVQSVDRALDMLFADCTADPACHEAFPDPRHDLDAAARGLEKAPAIFTATNPFTRAEEQITLTRTAFSELVRLMLYQGPTSRFVPLSLHLAAAGDYRLFASIAFQSARAVEDRIMRGAHFSVVCGEDVPWITDAEVERAGRGARFYGIERLRMYREACRAWPRSQVDASFATPVKSNAPVLMISGDADPVTAPELAANALKYLPNGKQVVLPHTGHAALSPCIDAIEQQFIERGSAATLDTACAAQIQRPPFATPALFGPSEPVKGGEIWGGTLEAGGQKLRLVLHVVRGAGGKLTGSLDSPDQNSNGLGVSQLHMEQGKLSFQVDLVQGKFEGTLNSEGTQATGEWSQSGLKLPLVLTRDARP